MSVKILILAINLLVFIILIVAVSILLVKQAELTTDTEGFKGQRDGNNGNDIEYLFHAPAHSKF